MTGNEYVKLAMRTNDGLCGHRLREGIIFNPMLGDALNGALGLAGEAGETLDMIKKWIFHGAELDKVHLEKELGDVMWYMAMLCNAFGFSLDEVMQLNIDKLKARYPDGFSEAASNNRRAGDV